MATINNTLTKKDGSLEDLKENIKLKLKEKPRKKDSLNLSKKRPKKPCGKTKESKEKYGKLVRNQEDQCLDSPSSTLEGNEVFGQPIPELYPELSEELERPMDTSLSADENNNKQEIRPQIKENHDDSQYSSDDSQPIGIKKRRKMLIPKKFERQLNLDSDDDEESPVSNPINESDSKQKVKDASEKQTQRTGSWVQCSLPHCGKWRCLNDKVDPNNLPDKWVCSMNPDSRYNRCQVSQEDFDSQDEDFDVVYSPYPEGAIVWAKLAGYPWWPGMMENDPDYGYYCETDEHSREPLSYHVVFFDKDVSRAWVSTCNVRLFQADDNPEDQGNVVIRKKNFKKKLDLAAEQAKQALSLSPENRLDAYGFARRFKGPIGHQNKPNKHKKTKLGAVEEEDIGEEGERHEEDEDGEYEEDYLNSAESNEYSESSENFSQEFCKKTKKKTPTKKMKKSDAIPANKLAKKQRKRETDNGEKSDTISKGVKTAASKVKKNNKPRKKSIHEIEKAAKFNSTEKGKTIQDNTQPMSAACTDTKELVTSPTSSEPPKSPIPPSYEGESPGQISFDVAKETTIKEKTKLTKKRKLGNKKKDGVDLEEKEKTPRKESKQTNLQEHETRIKPDKKPAKMMATNQCKTQGLELQKIVGLKKPLGQEKHLSDKTDTEDVQIPDTAQSGDASSTASSSFQFTNMPKLIKASFKPPSKRSSESNTFCPKPLKMPKLWKPQFVCPAAAAAEKASNLLKGNKEEQSFQSEKNDCKQAQVVNRSVRDDQERCSIADKTPYLQNKAARKDPGLNDEVEVELAKLDKDIEDMKKEFNNSMNPIEKKKLPLKGDMILTEDSPEF